MQVSLINKILSIIDISPKPKNWRDRTKHNGYFWKLKRRIRNILRALAGSNSDFIEMLKDILTDTEKLTLSDKLTAVLKEFAKVYNNEAQKKRFRFIWPFRKSNLSYETTRKFGFKVSKHLW